MWKDEALTAGELEEEAVLVHRVLEELHPLTHDSDITPRTKNPFKYVLK